VSLTPELSVTDLRASLEFYVGTLGFAVVYQRQEEGFAFLRLGAAELMLDQIGVGRDWQTGGLEKPFGRGINFQILVDSLEPILKNLADHRIPLFMNLEERWYRRDALEVGNRQFLVQDPDGYLLRFYEDLGQRRLNTRGDA
jgi:catechol 2,3-dioxygenase-like lactoylglutathione lyase family enzyme